MRNLVRRYVTVEQRKAESQGVTEDDVNEIKQDISAFRCELIEILKNSGMNTSTASGVGTGKGSFIELYVFDFPQYPARENFLFHLIVITVLQNKPSCIKIVLKRGVSICVNGFSEITTGFR